MAIQFSLIHEWFHPPDLSAEVKAMSSESRIPKTMRVEWNTCLRIMYTGKGKAFCGEDLSLHDLFQRESLQAGIYWVNSGSTDKVKRESEVIISELVKHKEARMMQRDFSIPACSVSRNPGMLFNWKFFKLSISQGVFFSKTDSVDLFQLKLSPR